MSGLHLHHWHRNALFGTLRGLTTFCDTCSGEVYNTPGEGLVSWSPDGSQMTYSAHFNTAADGQRPCQIYITSASPAVGVHGRPFTASGARDSAAQSAASDSSDYDPQWSPRGNEIIWDRDDVVLYRKGIAGAPGVTDTLERSILVVPAGHLYANDIGLAPDGEKVALVVGAGDGSSSSIYTVNIDGTGVHQVTAATSGTYDDYPAWSTDGKLLTFERITSSGANHTVVLENVLSTASPSTAASPVSSYTINHSLGAPSQGFSSDNATILAGLPMPGAGTTNGVNTLDVTGGAGSTPPPILYYDRFVSGKLMSTRSSSDGTRLGLLAFNPAITGATTPQLWAAQRNMSLPPTITMVAGDSVNPAAPTVDVTIGRDSTLTMTTTRSDPEGDALADSAYFLRPDLGMSWSGSTHTLTWNVLGVPVGTYTVRLQTTTPSGGTGYALAHIHVRDLKPPSAPADLDASCDPDAEDTWDLSWTAPADDSDLTVSGAATAYDIRVSGASITLANWASATSIGGPTPGSPGATDTWTETVTGTTYLRMKARDAVGNWSGLSGQLVLHSFLDCGGGGMFVSGGGDGGGGATARRAPGALGAHRLAGEAVAGEVSVLQNGMTGVRAGDIVEIPRLAVAGSVYTLGLRVAAGSAMSLDRIGLLSVAHSSNEQAYLLREWPIVGVTVPAVSARDGSGASMTTLVNGTDATGYEGVSGASFTVQLSPDSSRERDPIVIEGSGLGADSSSVIVEVPDAQSVWRAVREVTMRSNYRDATVDSVTSDSIRLLYHGAVAIRLVGRVVRSNGAPLISWSPIASATDPTAGDILSQVQAADSAAVTLLGPDTLSLGFTVPALRAGLVRDCFFSLSAVPLDPRTVTKALASGSGPNAVAGFAFRLLQNQPNPFTRVTTLRFELPMASSARLEVFDLQGRQVRALVDQTMSAGPHSVTWDGRDASGRLLSPGLYLYRLRAGNLAATQRMAIVGR